jgi:hypothetical protein
MAKTEDLPAAAGTDARLNGVALCANPVSRSPLLAAARTIYAKLQSPLYLPDSDAGKASRNARILAFDLATAAPSAEYVYQFDNVNAFDPSAEGDPGQMKLSAIAWIDGERFIIDERTDPVAKLYLVDLSAATNILGT